MARQILQPEQKALEINLNNKIYGTFAEIGAGQEVARNFFQAGAAAGTICKTMSAYDKTFSDAIYGCELSGRYVCESRLYNMLDHEYQLMEERLSEELPDTNFFIFADTVAAINYHKTILGNGWLGVRFQLNPTAKPNDFVLHVRMLDNDNRLQQEAIGLLGVNMLYACYFLHDKPEEFVQSLMDGLKGRVMIDMLSVTGPDFDYLDNRLLSLYMVKFGLTDVAMFDENGKNIHASEHFYKKQMMVVRGHFKPPTSVTLDVFKTSYDQFIELEDVDPSTAISLTEITLDNLRTFNNIDDQDFLERASALNVLGKKVIVSNCSDHQSLINYLSAYKVKKLGIVIGALEMIELINEKFLNNQDGRILASFGEIFTRNIKVFIYPVFGENGEIIDAHNLPVPEGIKFLYKYLLESQQIVDIKGYNKELLNIVPYMVLKEIQSDINNWESKMPEALASLIKEKKMFGFQKSSELVTG